MPEHTHDIIATASTVDAHEHDWYSGPYGGSQYSTSADSAGVGAETTRHKTKPAGSHSHEIIANISESGGNNIHNNLPPYLCIYIFRRIS